MIILLKKESFFSSDPSIWQMINQDSSIQARITNISLYIFREEADQLHETAQRNEFNYGRTEQKDKKSGEIYSTEGSISS